MDNLGQSSNKKNIVLIISAIVLIVGLVLMFIYYRGEFAGFINKDDTLDQQLQVSKQDLKEEVLPDKFPGDLPMESGAKVTQNYSSTSIDGRYQGTRVYETTKTLDENKTLYLDYFNKNGWLISGTTEADSLRVINASKGDLNIQVVINENTLTQQITVEVSVSELKKT